MGVWRIMCGLKVHTEHVGWGTRSRGCIMWMYYGDRCVRTVVQECFDVTGRNYMKEEKRVGTVHVAVDDCRHQVRYLVKARNALAGRAAQQGQQGRTGLMSSGISPPEHGRQRAWG